MIGYALAFFAGFATAILVSVGFTLWIMHSDAFERRYDWH